MIAWLIHRILHRVPVLTDDRQETRLHHAIQGAHRSSGEQLTFGWPDPSLYGPQTRPWPGCNEPPCSPEDRWTCTYHQQPHGRHSRRQSPPGQQVIVASITDLADYRSTR
jgi:hypothetical protein